MNQREKFEAWNDGRLYLDLASNKQPDGTHIYLWGNTQYAWEVWQAALASQSPAMPWWLADKIIAYASSHEGHANCVISKAQFDNALPKNRTEYDVPLVRVDASQPPKEAMSDSKIKMIAYGFGIGSEVSVNFARAIIASTSPNKELVAALKELCDLVRLEVADGEHTTEFLRAHAALAAAGVMP